MVTRKLLFAVAAAQLIAQENAARREMQVFWHAMERYARAHPERVSILQDEVTYLTEHGEQGFRDFCRELTEKGQW